MRRRRTAVVFLAGLLPWVAVTWPGGWYPLFSVGFLQFDPLTFTSLPAYVERVGTVPEHLSAWPIATLLWAAALASAPFERVDGTVTVGLLALAGASVLSLSLELSGQRGITAIPLGALWLWAAAGVEYAALFRSD
ncbi:TIGR04206 family protein [Halobacterium litoreum]|uniref:TIGR04206 family protein n=1 Tax=Halobacterium litoreum TaxID=2039234 RepID=A0ABD5NBB9_9EURY|nr:TIGR04206 family protein [Halobacterium litoreum]UHH14622.1 TIGR04206 family protein [Halobacterium litoreum]